VNDVMKILRKELREMFRDKRVRFNAFVMPVFLIILMNQLFGFAISAAVGATKATVYLVSNDAGLSKVFTSAGMTIKTVPTVDEGVKLIKEGRAKLVLAPMPPTTDGQVRLEAYYDPKQQMGNLALAGVKQAVEALNRDNLKQTLEAKMIPATAAEHVKLVPKEVAIGEKGAGELIVALLPYMIVLFAFSGGMSMAADLVAGEKEKSTLETLLITPVGRNQIVTGKFLALCVVCFLSSASCLLGMVVSSALKTPGSQQMFKDGFGVTPLAAGTILLLLLPLVAMFASILIAISSYAKNPREAQTYLALVNFIVIMPAIFSQFIGLTDLQNKLWINTVPVLNTANNIRAALLGKTDWTAVGITFAVSVLLAAVAIKIAVALFNREQVLVRV
jgi:sodium transport system permease protein